MCTMSKSLLWWVLFIIISKNTIGQIVVQIDKTACSNKQGYYIKVCVRNQGILLDSNGVSYYDYSDLYRLADSIKIKVIEKLFDFTSDSSICCKKVLGYENADYPGCYSGRPSTNIFSIRIEALFIINRIAYNSFTSRIGCFPVLYDTVTEQEVNENNCMVDLMVGHYKEWFEMYKKTGKLPTYLFLNKSRVKWWGRHLD